MAGEVSAGSLIRYANPSRRTPGNPKNSETAAWLYYHLQNVSGLVLAARNLVTRLDRNVSAGRRGCAPARPALRFIGRATPDAPEAQPTSEALVSR
jgi:hypothetical protein